MSEIQNWKKKWKLSVRVWVVVPKITIDLGDVAAVTLNINAVTFSSCFGSNVARAAKKDGYVEDGICHADLNWASECGIAHLDCNILSSGMWNYHYHYQQKKQLIYWNIRGKWACKGLDEEQKKEGKEKNN